MAVSYLLIAVAAWAVLLALVLVVGRRIAHVRERREAAAWVERRGGDDRRVLFDRRSGLTDRRMGLPDERPDPVERRRGPPNRRDGCDRRSGEDRRTAAVV